MQKPLPQQTAWADGAVTSLADLARRAPGWTAPDGYVLIGGELNAPPDGSPLGLRCEACGRENVGGRLCVRGRRGETAEQLARHGYRVVAPGALRDHEHGAHHAEHRALSEIAWQGGVPVPRYADTQPAFPDTGRFFMNVSGAMLFACGVEARQQTWRWVEDGVVRSQVIEWITLAEAESVARGDFAEGRPLGTLPDGRVVPELFRAKLAWHALATVRARDTRQPWWMARAAVEPPPLLLPDVAATQRRRPAAPTAPVPGLGTMLGRLFGR